MARNSPYCIEDITLPDGKSVTCLATKHTIYPLMAQLAADFNKLSRPERLSKGYANNHWHVSIRKVHYSVPGDVVVFCQPSSHHIHYYGPVYTPGGSPYCLIDRDNATSNTIARIILEEFVKGLGLDSPHKPWSWCTDDHAFGPRITSLLRSMGMNEEALFTMPVACANIGDSVDDDWRDMQVRMLNHAAMAYVL